MSTLYRYLYQTPKPNTMALLQKQQRVAASRDRKAFSACGPALRAVRPAGMGRGSRLDRACVVRAAAEEQGAGLPWKSVVSAARHPPLCQEPPAHAPHPSTDPQRSRRLLWAPLRPLRWTRIAGSPSASPRTSPRVRSGARVALHALAAAATGPAASTLASLMRVEAVAQARRKQAPQNLWRLAGCTRGLPGVCSAPLRHRFARGASRQLQPRPPQRRTYATRDARLTAGHAQRRCC